MKKFIVLSLIGLLLNFKLEAQKREGLIIFEDDTLKVIFNIPHNYSTGELDFEKLQYKVVYFNTQGKKRAVLKPNEAKEIQFKYRDQNIRMLSRHFHWGVNNIMATTNYVF